MNSKILVILVIGLIALSMTIRMQPLEYGWELDGMDSFYNYRALTYLENNGLQSYLEWQDDKVWYPEGRNISATSQVMSEGIPISNSKMHSLGCTLLTTEVSSRTRNKL